jgi:hypothetical protein
VLAHLIALAPPVDVRYLWRPRLPDEGDDFVMEIAISASPCSIVTHHLRDFVNAELHFPQVPLPTPGQLLSRLSNRGKNS